MTTVELLSKLRSLGVQIQVEEGRLRYRAPKGGLPPDLRTELAARKAEVIAFLHRADTAQNSPLLPVARDEAPVLSFAQQRLWFLNQLEPDNAFYNLPVSIRLEGQLNLVAMRQALTEIAQRHEVLRTTFATVNGQPVQFIASNPTLPLPVVDLRNLAIPERAIEAMRLAKEEIQRPFNLAQGPLLRISLLQLGDQDYLVPITMHHIISDSWSIAVLIREIALLYEAYNCDRSCSLPSLPIQYADFAHWQRRWLEGDAQKVQLAYWKKQLGGSLPRLVLPTDRPRPVAQTFRGAIQEFKLSATLSNAIKALSQQEGCTPFMTLLAAFKVLLYRYTEQSDIIVGSPVANRNRAEIEPLIGFFVNMLVLRTNLSGNPSFRELLGRVREVSLEAYAHQDLPFEMLVEELQPERSLSYAPLFQIVFALDNAPMEPLTLPGLTITSVGIESGTAQFDIVLSMRESDQELTGLVEYSVDLFDVTTITRMLEHFQTLLEGMVSNPERQILDLPLLPEAEQRRLLIEWNDTRIKDDYQRLCLHQWFEAQAMQTPEAVAVIFKDELLTYGELNSRANQLAHHLQKLGVSAEVLVGICVERSLEMIVGLLGVLKAGGAYVPLDPIYPRERLAFLLQDAQISVLLSQRHLADKFLEHQGPTLYLDTDGPWRKESEVNPSSPVIDENLAYIIYTSGSTGNPKGVMITHRAVCNTLLRMVDIFQIKAEDCGLHKSTLCVDGSLWEIFVPLLVGARLVLAEPELHLDPDYLLHLIKDHGITTMDFVSSTLQLFLRGQELEKNAATLRRVWCGGEALPYDLKERFLAHVPAKLFHDYGPTEAALSVTYWLCQPKEEAHTIPIGRPIGNMQIYILDAHLQPTPIGIAGELYIGGFGLARGYLDRPGLTAERFIPHPFSEEPGAYLYKTGDIARYWPDGNIEFLGRIDHQVKVHGFRVELGEIEAALSQHPVVQEAVVVIQEDTPLRTPYGVRSASASRKRYHQRLVAYIVPGNGLVPTVHDLRNFLRAKLPEHMVPTIFNILESMPLLPGGKVDRRLLAAVKSVKLESEATFTASRTPTEEILVKIWEQVLGVEQVGVHDNFFELGGDSILSIQILAKANEAGLRLTVKQLFQYQTIAELAAVTGTEPLISAEQGLVTGPILLSPIQHWFFEQSLPDPHHWNQSVLLKVHQPLKPALLEQVVYHLLLQHDTLRLRFKQQGSTWQPVIAGLNEAVPFERINLTALPPASRVTALESAAAGLQASLNLVDGPLLRVALFYFGPQDPDRLLIIIHHQVVDSVSWQILLNDFQNIYRQLSRGETVSLPPKSSSFAQWSKRLTKYAQLAVLRAELDYWLAEPRLHVLGLPVDYPTGERANTVASAQTISMSLDDKETQMLLQEVPKVYNTQITDVLLTALAKTFVAWTGTQLLLVDLEGHGREPIFDDIDISRTVGWFTTLFPVLLRWEKNFGLGEALKSIKEQLRYIPNGGIGYGLLRYLSEDIEIIKKLRALPQAEIVFEYMGQLDQILPETSPFELAQEFRGPEQSLRGRRPYLLEISGVVLQGRLKMYWVYSGEIYRPATIQSLAQTFIESLRSLLAHCLSLEAGGYTPSDFPEAGLSQAELDELVATFDGV